MVLKEDTQIRNGLLSKYSTTGKGLITEQVVAEWLGVANLNIKYNDFNHTFDLFHKKYGRINVKGRKLRVGVLNGQHRNSWNFRFKYYYLKNRVDTYVLVGFDNYRKNILRVWIISSNAIFNKETVSISNTVYGLSVYKAFEVDAKSFNDILHKISKKECKFLCDV